MKSPLSHRPYPWLMALLIGSTAWPAIAASAYAQITPDETLGSEASTVTPNVPLQGAPAELIEGGAMRGSNLFHSFDDFNVETLQRVYFANPDGIENILTRITGGNASSIDGRLGVDGRANLYLLNPNGVVFGPNAQLDIRGSFITSTADGWYLDNGGVFSALDPEAPPLLSVNLTPGLQYGATQQADVSNEGNLAVGAGEHLVLLGQTVTSAGTLTAPGGQVRLLGDRVGLTDTGRIEVSSPTGGGTVNLGGDAQGAGTLPTARQTFVAPNASIAANATDVGDGGDVIIWADETTQFYGTAAAQGGAVSGDGGFVEVSSADWLDFRGQVDTTAAHGVVGTLLLDPTNIRVVDDATAETFDIADVAAFEVPDIGGDGETLIAASAINGATSNVVLQATESISFDEPILFTTPFLELRAIAGENITVNQPITTFFIPTSIILEAQNITISASIFSFGGNLTLLGENNISLDNGAIVESGEPIFSLVDAGEIRVRTSGTLSLVEGARISSSAFGEANGGDTSIFANSIVLDGVNIIEGIPSGIASEVAVGASGDGGNITIEANTLSATNGSRISTTNVGDGKSGNLLVNVDQIELSGFEAVGETLVSFSGIVSEVNASGDGGDVVVNTDDISVTNGAIISVANRGEGTAGNLSVNADKIEVDGFGIIEDIPFVSGINSRVFASGVGGDVTVAADNIVLNNGAIISTSNRGAGRAGSLSVNADRLEVDGFASIGGTFLGISSINSEVFASGAGGEVVVDAENISVTNGATISTSNRGAGIAGSLSVNADQLEVDGFTPIGEAFFGISSINSEVLASGNGGEVVVDAENISVTNGATISTSNRGSGIAGNLSVSADQIEVDGLASIGEIFSDVSSISSTVFASGRGGEVVVDANTISVTNGAGISTSNRGEGDSGSLSVSANQIDLDGFAAIGETAFSVSGITSQVFASGTGGATIVEADTISVTNGATISTSNIAGSGTAGNLSVTADSTIDLDGFAAVAEPDRTVSGISSQVFASGTGGEVVVDASNILVTGSAVISTSNIEGDGAAGDLLVIADQIRLDGFGAIEESRFGFGITSEVLASGTGGNVTVEAGDIFVTNNATISTRTAGIRDAGQLDVSATDRVELREGGTISSESFTAANSGEVLLTAGDVVLRNGAEISAGTFATPEVANASEAVAGEVRVTAGSVVLDDDSVISTTGNLGNGGNLSVTANDFLLLRNGSRISTSAGLLTAGGDGGNITINTPFVVSVLSEDSDITANAFAGNGGSVTISALDIIGLEFQDEPTSFSDITASSEIGVDGPTVFNPLSDESIEGSLTELPVNLADPTGLISQQCALQASDSASEFTVVGRGGLPPDPSQPGTTDTFLEDLGGTFAEPANNVLEQSRTSMRDEREPLTAIREAQSWIQDASGRVYLVSNASESSTTALPTHAPLCSH